MHRALYMGRIRSGNESLGVELCKCFCCKAEGFGIKRKTQESFAVAFQSNLGMLLNKPNQNNDWFFFTLCKLRGKVKSSKCKE